MCVCVNLIGHAIHVCPISSLICSSLRMSYFILGYNELRKVPDVSQILLAPTDDICRKGTNNEINIMTSYINLRKE